MFIMDYATREREREREKRKRERERDRPSTTPSALAARLAVNVVNVDRESQSPN